MALANIVNADMDDIDVKIASGPLFSIWNVKGAGLENAATVQPASEPAVPHRLVRPGTDISQ